MARVTFIKGQRIRNLSGQMGNLRYRTVGGKTFLYQTEEAELPKDATRKEKRLHKRKCIVNQCVELIQRQMGDLEVALAMRPKIRDRMVSLYDRFAPKIKARTKLQRAMMTEYGARFSIENDSILVREKLGIDPMTKRKEL